MITSVHAPEVPASLEVLFVGESCHCCGQPEPLELFKMEAILGEERLCTRPDFVVNVCSALSRR